MSDTTTTRKKLTPEERETKRLEQIEREQQRKKDAQKRMRNIKNQRRLNVADYIESIAEFENMTLSDLKQILETSVQCNSESITAEDVIKTASSFIRAERAKADADENQEDSSV